MLEHRILLIRRRTASMVQSIVAAEGDLPLGFARWHPEPSLFWGALLGQRVLAVHEDEDEPLLFTIHRCWGLPPCRAVLDADGQPVGHLLRRGIQDRFGNVVAGWREGAFHSPHQRLLAELTTTTDEMRLTFHDNAVGEPFLKMLLLAAVLCENANYEP